MDILAAAAVSHTDSTRVINRLNQCSSDNGFKQQRWSAIRVNKAGPVQLIANGRQRVHTTTNLAREEGTLGYVGHAPEQSSPEHQGGNEEVVSSCNGSRKTSTGSESSSVLVEKLVRSYLRPATFVDKIPTSLKAWVSAATPTCEVPPANSYRISKTV